MGCGVGAVPADAVGALERGVCRGEAGRRPCRELQLGQHTEGVERDGPAPTHGSIADSQALAGCHQQPAAQIVPKVAAAPMRVMTLARVHCNE